MELVNGFSNDDELHLWLQVILQIPFYALEDWLYFSCSKYAMIRMDQVFDTLPSGVE